MPKPQTEDTRPIWEREDEGSNFPLRNVDREVIYCGAKGSGLAGLAAGFVIGVLPWGITLLLRAALGGGWSFHHWTWNLTIYGLGSLPLGLCMGWLRRWSAMGHRYREIPMANTRAGWDAWLAIAAVDIFVMEMFMVDRLGVLLIFLIWGLVWAGVVYSMLWTKIHDKAVAYLRFRGQIARPDQTLNG